MILVRLHEAQVHGTIDDAAALQAIEVVMVQLGVLADVLQAIRTGLLLGHRSLLLVLVGHRDVDAHAEHPAPVEGASLVLTLGVEHPSRLRSE
jgi:hypothetical protein